MKTTYSVGELSRTAGLPPSTVRYYDRRGLLKPRARTEGNYRIYDGDASERLRFIRAAVSNGFTLEDIATLLTFRDGNSPACREVQDLIADRLDELRSRAVELARVQRALKSMLRRCRAAERMGKCQVIERLEITSLTKMVRTMRKPQKPR
jgi:DNA-binding transcriptional MerR regulator